jgi:glycosyltransferase involved in cell wall biosynthesis
MMKTPPHSVLAAASFDATPMRVLMLGTALEGQGGIASVVAVLRQDGLFEREGVHYLATHAEGSRAAKARHALRGLWRAAMILLRARPAIVHAHTASRASFFRKSLLLLLARACGARTIFHLHGAAFREFATLESGPLARWWIRHTLEASSAVIALSPAWADFLRGFAPAADVHVVPNSVRVERAAPAAAGEDGRILFLGRAGERKGLFDLLEALARVLPAHPQARLAIGGDGDLNEVRRRSEGLGIAGQVELLGWVGPEQKAAELARAAIFCLPSHAEGLPMAMLEAMAAGTAVVVTPVGGILDAVSDKANGLVVPPREVPALAAALSALLGDAELRARLGANARATIIERFSTEAVLGKLSSLYRDLARAGAR